MERAKQDTALKICISLAIRCRSAAQRRRRTAGKEDYWEAYAAWAQCWNALQVAKSIYNEDGWAKPRFKEW